MRTPYLVFGRDDDGEGEYAPWWPLYIDDGPHLAESPEAAIALVRERLALGGEARTWIELAAVPSGEFTRKGFGS